MLTTDDLARALDGDVVGVDSVSAPGPGHSLRDRSMSVTLAPDAPDGFVVNSFCGDDWATCRDHVRARLGLPPFEAKKKSANGNGNDGGRSLTFVAEYVYRTELGEPYHRVQRFRDEKGGKTFLQSHWVDGAWVSGKPPGPLAPYRLPELLAAPREAPVFTVEGEKCADTLTALGFVATCNVGGADSGSGKKWTPELNKWFTGRHVVIVGDNDEPGRRHVQLVARQLHGAAASVRILDLSEHWDAMSVGDDVADWISQHDRAGSRFAQFAKEAPLYEPAKAAAAGDKKEADSDDAEIRRLARLSPVDYERERKKAAERLGVRAAILDRLVKAGRPDDDSSKPGRAVLLADIEPWFEAVDGAALLDEIADAIGRHVVMTPHARDAAALWCVHTYLLDAIMVTPRLAIRSPTKRCGKTTLLDVLARLVLRPLSAANVTPAAVFRVVEDRRPCLLIDEADTFLAASDELRGVVNSGHRRGGAVLRTVGDDHEVRTFSTYGACAIALIGRLADTLHDRSVVIDLKRRLPSEKIDPFRSDRAGHLDELAQKAARWAQDNAASTTAADPQMPVGIFNRQADNWRGLLAISDAAGGHWPGRARAAALHCHEADDDDRLAALLGDIKAAFADRNTDRLSSAELVEALVAKEGGLWAEYGRTGKPISTNRLARLLARVGVVPSTKRIGDATAKGYRLDQFSESFARYLAPEGGQQPSHRHKPYAVRVSEESTTVTPDPDVTVANPLKPLPSKGCYGVTVAKGESANVHHADRLVPSATAPPTLMVSSPDMRSAWRAPPSGCTGPACGSGSWPIRKPEAAMGKHEGGFERVPKDLYPTPPWPVAALAEHVIIEGATIWEPAAGDGRMADALREFGAIVRTSDVRSHLSLDTVFDFVSGAPSPFGFDGIVTNPPYGNRNKLAERFIESALARMGNGFVAMLLPADFDSAKTRPRLFRDCPHYVAKITLTRRVVWFEPPPGERRGGPKENHAGTCGVGPSCAASIRSCDTPRNTEWRFYVRVYVLHKDNYLD